MNKQLLERVTVVAQDVRDWVELRAQRVNNYDLNGFCAIAAGQLHKKLTNIGIDAKISLRNQWGECHAFVVVDDHVIDVTATQFQEFENTPIVILHIKEAEVYSFYCTDNEFKNSVELRKHQQRDKWPINQIAYA